MPYFNIKNFKGINKKADSRDIDNHECQTLDGFDVSTKFGALVKRKGYTDQANVILPASYPSSWTIKNFFEFRVNKPSTKKIYIVHATVGGEDRIYVSDTYNGSAWVQGWVELTENEEEMTVDSSADTTHFVDAGLASSTDDYYNGWFVFNWTREIGSLVSDYAGSTNTITLKTAIAGMAATDSYSIYRYPLILQYEHTNNYTSDTGSNTTQTIDYDDPTTEFYELRQDFDDAYDGWVLNNASRGDTASVTAYEANYANSERKLSHGAIAGATDGDSYFLYKKTRTLNVDDNIQFIQRRNACVMSIGNNTGRYPKQFPLWYGFIRKTYYFGQSGNNIDDGYYLEPATLDSPDDDIFTSASASTDASDPLTSGADYYFSMAYIYDGYQVGPLTSISKANSNVVSSLAADKKIQLTITIGFSGGFSMRHSHPINKRVTSLEIFCSTNLNTTTKEATWYRVYSVPIREDFNIEYGGVKKYPPSQAYERRPFGQRRGISERDSITPSGRTKRTRSGKVSRPSWASIGTAWRVTVDITGTDWTNKGDYYTFHSGGMGGDRINYKVCDEGNNHSVVGKIYGEDVEDSVMAFSPLKADGTPSPDYFPTLNVLDLGSYGIFNITNIRITNDFVYIIGDSKSLRMVMSSGLVPSFKVNSEYDFIGSESENGMVKKDNGLFLCGKKGVYFLDSYEHYLSLPIEDFDSFPLGATTMSEAYMAFNGQTNELYIAFPTDTKLYSYNLLTKQWCIHSVADGIKALVTGDDGEVYGADDTKIYLMNNGTTDDSTSINPSWKSKIYSLGLNKEIILEEVEVVYKSNTVIDFDVYINRGSASSWNTATDKQFPASTSLTSDRKEFPVTFRGHEIEFGISIPSASRATNTYVEIHEVNVKYRVEERID